METTGTIIPDGEGGFHWSLGDRRISREDEFRACSPGFVFKDAGYETNLRKLTRSSLVETTLSRLDCVPIGSLSFEFELRAEDERASDLYSVTRLDHTSRYVHCAVDISEFLSRRRRDGTFRGPVVFSFRLREEPPGGRRGAGAEVAAESNKDLEEDSTNETLKKLQEDFEKLFLSKEDSDVTLKIQDKKFPAHRNILRARSPVFDAMFTHDMEENRSGDVVIEDFDPDTFPDFLKYLYTGSTEHVAEQNVCQLFDASDKYEVLLLKEKCTEYMKSHVSVETFCDFIALALKHSEAELLRLATEFFCANAIEIAKTPKWQIFLRENSTVGNELFLKSWQRESNN